MKKLIITAFTIILIGLSSVQASAQMFFNTQLNPQIIENGKSYIHELSLDAVNVSYSEYGNNGFYLLEYEEGQFYTNDYIVQDGIVNFSSGQVLDLTPYAYRWNHENKVIEIYMPNLQARL